MPRNIVNGRYEFLEPEISYRAILGVENGALREENTFFWDKSA
jgi:hypothetical protein